MKKLLTRTLSAVVFAAITIAALLTNEFAFAAYMLFIMIGMMAEFFRMTMGDRYCLPRGIAMASGVIFFILVFAVKAFNLPLRYTALALLPPIVLLSTAIFQKEKAQFSDYAFLCTALLYIALPISLSSTVVLVDGRFNGVIILCFFIIIWLSDVGAYLVGMSLGQKGGKKLCPDISPKKSWAGFWGGILFAGVSGFILSETGLLNIPIYHGIILGIIMSLSGVAGDLFESMWKRHFGVKDSGNLIPGHGGLLDRFDSSLFAMPVGAIYLAITNLL